MKKTFEVIETVEDQYQNAPFDDNIACVADSFEEANQMAKKVFEREAHAQGIKNTASRKYTYCVDIVETTYDEDGEVENIESLYRYAKSL